MFISIKKRTIFICLAFVVFAVSVSFIVAGATSSESAAAKNGKVVVIDAGHGGIDGGVSGVKTGTKESDINLAIARSLKHFLTSRGYEVVMTRSTTDGLYGMSTKNRKMRDMEARKKIITDARPDLVVSVHQNAYPRPSEKGAQIFYAPSSETSKQIASTMQNILGVTLDTKRSARIGDYYILQCSEYPSVLVECGFLSNPEEEKLLISASYQEKVAYAIFSGIHAVIGAQSSNAS